MPSYIAWWKSRWTFGRIQEQINENTRRTWGFSPAWEFSQTLLRFSTGYGGTENMFYFFYKIIIFSVNKEKDDIRSVYCKFLQLADSQTTFLTSFSCFVALWKHTCWPIKTHKLSTLFYKYYWFDIMWYSCFELRLFNGITVLQCACLSWNNMGLASLLLWKCSLSLCALLSSENFIPNTMFLVTVVIFIWYMA